MWLVAAILDSADDRTSSTPQTVLLDSPVSRARTHKIDSIIQDLAIIYKQENYPLRINTHGLGTKVSRQGKNSLISNFPLKNHLGRGHVGDYLLVNVALQFFIQHGSRSFFFWLSTRGSGWYLGAMHKTYQGCL